MHLRPVPNGKIRRFIVGRGLAPAANPTNTRSTPDERCCGKVFDLLEFTRTIAVRIIPNKKDFYSLLYPHYYNYFNLSYR